MNRIVPRVADLRVIGLTSALLLTGCGDDAADPVEQLEEAVEQAEAATEQIKDDLETRTDDVEAMQQRVEATAQKLVQLSGARIDALGRHITDLPAEQEAAYAARIDQLRQQKGELETALNQYTAHNAAAGPDAWAPIRTQLDSLDEALLSFEADLAEAMGE